MTLSQIPVLPSFITCSSMQGNYWYSTNAGGRFLCSGSPYRSMLSAFAWPHASFPANLGDASARHLAYQTTELLDSSSQVTISSMLHPGSTDQHTAITH